MRHVTLLAGSAALFLPYSGALAAPPRDTDILVTGEREEVARASDLASAPARVLAGEALEEERSQSLGETLARLPGVQNSYQGPLAGRPQIRGQAGNRVALRLNGLALDDMSGITGDHAAPIEPFLADVIEVLNGSAGVLYGGHAIGGAVNLRDGRIPRSAAKAPLSGRAQVSGGFNTPVTAMARLDGGKDDFAWHADMLYRHAGDFDIPGLAKADECRSWADLVTNVTLQGICQVRTASPQWAYDPDQGRYVDATPAEQQIIEDPAPGRKGKLVNSGLETVAVNLGASHVGSQGYFGLAAGYYRSDYGVPGFQSVTPASPSPSPIAIAAEQLRLDIDGVLYAPLPGLAAVRLRAGSVRSHDRERIDGNDASAFEIHSDTVRLELTQAALGPLTGVLGGEVNHRKLETRSDTAYLPSVETTKLALFALERLTIGPVRLSAGGRHDWIEQDLDETSLRDGRGLGVSYAQDRDFRLWNAFGALRVTPLSWLHLDARYALGERAPEVNELYANGNHFASLSDEQGDGRLRKERSQTWELGGTLDLTPFTLSVTGYRVNYEDYIYLGNTGISRTLPVREWRQGDTRFKGIEGEATLRVPQVGPGDLELHVFADHVLGKPRFHAPDDYSPFNFDYPSNAQWTAEYYRRQLDGEYLPRMPVSRYGADAALSGARWRVSAGTVHFARQTRFSQDETASPGYWLVDAHARYKLPLSAHDIEIFVDATNLTNTEARAHNSPLRYRAPLVGRAVTLGARAAF
ncbi:TonB-dependent receptor [Novosphingobium decolorationis]|uniref:TonB-dependent receptor n=1 Tax=Novosphingobium decolorationis TaxID=2698673 RepID=A0ABX8E9C5_9SPHN|nr:TonB-dependent receptor [Novosphingobium decolorationis]QVM84776.1 TonB-dependent receptor [Novosphingobium decolorationis]